MISPCGTVVFGNLATSIVNIGGLPGELKKGTLTYYTMLGADNFSGTRFLRSDTPTDAIEGDGKVIGNESASPIMQRYGNSNVRTDVHETSGEFLNVWNGWMKDLIEHGDDFDQFGIQGILGGGI